MCWPQRGLSWGGGSVVKRVVEWRKGFGGI